jgi:hypothetical protein
MSGRSMSRTFARIVVVAAASWMLLVALAIVALSASRTGKSWVVVPSFVSLGIILVALGAAILLLGLRRAEWAPTFPAWMRGTIASGIAAGIALILALSLWALASIVVVANLLNATEKVSLYDFYTAAGLWIAVVVPIGAGWFLYAAAVALRSVQASEATRYFGTVLLSFGLCWIGLAGLCTATFTAHHHHVSFEYEDLLPALSIAFGAGFALLGWSLRGQQI